MHRQDLINKLTNYSPEYQEEVEFRASFLTFVKANETCFERSLAEGHVTGSAWILNKERTHTLLMHHAKLNRWLQLGGHADGDSNVEAVAMKEAEEESGLKHILFINHDVFDIDIHLIPARKQDPDHYHYDVRFQFEADMNEPLEINSESNDLQWVPLDKIKDFTDERSILRMVEKTLNAQQ
ncbi:NUDIX hydrolase [Fulvivirga ligni]|uniref:NUDIX hydrolase n=1 Tax=Fulvivirga ligni TaxID=2904246 RepID=UPI001F1AC1CF|nr:NUDIX hydrolase [Fulvivirga ligni]UII20234.1 NUDIX hydrolase [Fulvivirga ligni]